MSLTSTTEDLLVNQFLTHSKIPLNRKRATIQEPKKPYSRPMATNTKKITIDQTSNDGELPTEPSFMDPMRARKLSSSLENYANLVISDLSTMLPKQ